MCVPLTSACEVLKVPLTSLMTLNSPHRSGEGAEGCYPLLPPLNPAAPPCRCWRGLRSFVTWCGSWVEQEARGLSGEHPSRCAGRGKGFAVAQEACVFGPVCRRCGLKLLSSMLSYKKRAACSRQ